MSKHVTILGAGSWGTALAIVLSDNDINVRLWTREKEQVEEINQHRKNEFYLPGIELPEKISAYHDLREAIQGIETIVVAIPTKRDPGSHAKLKETFATSRDHCSRK